MRQSSQEATAVIPVRGGCLGRGGGGGVGEKHLGSGHILNAEPSGFAQGLMSMRERGE